MNPECPTCGGKMVLRQGRRGPFWGCADYPRCMGVRNARLKSQWEGGRKTNGV